MKSTALYIVIFAVLAVLIHTLYQLDRQATARFHGIESRCSVFSNSCDATNTAR